MSFEPVLLTSEQIELASQILLKSFSAANPDVTIFPTPVEEIAEFFLQYELVFTNERLYADPNFLGGICFESDVIYLNTALESHEGRLAFTIAHEIGHHCLHKQTYLEYLKGQTPEILCREAAEKPLIERQADQFAACLLLPKNEMIERWHNPKIKDVYAAYREATSFIKTHGVSNVSTSALINRLIDLSLIPDVGYQSGKPKYIKSFKSALLYRLYKLLKV